METENQVLEGDPRTESEILRGVASVTFGGKTYEIKEMKANQSTAFRRTLGEALAPFFSTMMNQPQSEWANLLVPVLFSDGVDKLVEMVFEYDPTLPKEEILATATEAELIEAAGVVFDLSRPLFVAVIQLTMKIMEKVNGG